MEERDCWGFSLGCFHFLRETKVSSPLISEDREGSAGGSEGLTKAGNLPGEYSRVRRVKNAREGARA